MICKGGRPCREAGHLGAVVWLPRLRRRPPKSERAGEVKVLPILTVLSKAVRDEGSAQPWLSARRDSRETPFPGWNVETVLLAAPRMEVGFGRRMETI